MPARGIGKSVIDALDAIDPAADDEAANTPLLSAGLAPAPTPRSLWARLLMAIDKRLVPARALAAVSSRSATSSRRCRQPSRARTVSSALSSCSIEHGYLQELRDERSEEAEARIENLMELVSAAREYETRETDASLGGFVDRLSLLSEADEAEGAQEAHVWLMTMHAAKGLEFPMVVVAGMEEGLFPHSRAVGRRGRHRRRAPALLRVPHARARAARADERRAAPDFRRVSADGAVSFPGGNPRGARRSRSSRRRPRRDGPAATSCATRTAAALAAASRARGRRERDVRVRERRPVGVGRARRHARPPSTVRRRDRRRPSRSTATTTKSPCDSRRSAPRSCSPASRASSRRDAWRPRDVTAAATAARAPPSIVPAP